MKASDLRPFCEALRTWRRSHGMTQEQMGAALDLSRKTYLLFENERWLPTNRGRTHIVGRLHAMEPSLALTLVTVLGRTLAEHGIAPSAPARSTKVPLDPKTASAAFDIALYATAEELDMSPKELRRIAAALLTRVADSGVTVEQAVSFSRAVRAPTRPPG